MNPYLEFVENIQTGIEQAKEISNIEGRMSNIEPDENAATVLLFSPHPDDECITGLLPLRLMREAGKRIINIPITFGSNVDRQAGRAAELKAACDFLGWEIFREEDGFQSLERTDVLSILEKFQPEIIFMPHSKDWNSRHISTHFLVLEALEKMPNNFSCTVVDRVLGGNGRPQPND